jgi:hypothetical protein
LVPWLIQNIKIKDQGKIKHNKENMLQRAASNAYSWWWVSHIRTKQSKWMEQNLQGSLLAYNIFILIIIL